jgi:myo-inositol-1(or 4)-monophosphatase
MKYPKANANLIKISDIAQRVMREVGANIKDSLNKQSERIISYKGADEIVTDIDIWAEKEIIKYVSKEFPNHLVIGEETSERLTKETDKSINQLTSEHLCWVVDPLDGTNNFANNIPHVAVSIGIVEKGTRIAGFVYDPVRDEFFSATRGGGASLNGKPINVSSKKNLDDSIIVCGFPYDRKNRWKEYRPAYEAIFEAARDLRRTGSAALDQCWVACGRFDAFFEYSLKPWDVAAGSLIVEEALGKAGNFDNEYKTTKGFSIFAKSFFFAGPQVFDEIYNIAMKAIETHLAQP